MTKDHDTLDDRVIDLGAFTAKTKGVSGPGEDTAGPLRGPIAGLTEE